MATYIAIYAACLSCLLTHKSKNECLYTVTYLLQYYIANVALEKICEEFSEYRGVVYGSLITEARGSGGCTSNIEAIHSYI